MQPHTQYTFPPTKPPIALDLLDSYSNYTLLIKTNTWSMELFYSLFCEYQNIVLNSPWKNLHKKELRKIPLLMDNTITTNSSGIDQNRYQDEDKTNDTTKFILPIDHDDEHQQLLYIDNKFIDKTHLHYFSPSHSQFKTQFKITTFPRNVLRFKPFRFTNAMMLVVFWAAKNLGFDCFLVDLDLYDFDESDVDLFLLGRWSFVPISSQEEEKKITTSVHIK